MKLLNTIKLTQFNKVIKLKLALTITLTILSFEGFGMESVNNNKGIEIEECDPPSKPVAPSVSSNKCGRKILTMKELPPGVSWYWQGTTKEGTSTANSSSAYTVTEPGTYYIRARKPDGCWSDSQSIVIAEIIEPCE